MTNFRNRNILKVLISYLLFSSGFSSAKSQGLEWVSPFQGESEEIPYDIAVDLSGNVLTTGYIEGVTDFDPSEGELNLNAVDEEDIFISKLDGDGNLVWARRIGDENSEVGYGIDTDGEGNVIATGFFQGSVDFDPGEGEFILTTPPSSDVFVLKLSPEGNFLWAKSFSGVLDEIGFDITVDESGNLYITGEFGGTVDFDPGPGVFEIASVDARDVFVVKLDQDGDLVWARSFGGESQDVGLSIAVDEEENVFVTGRYREEIDLDPGEGEFGFISEGEDDIFIAKLNVDGDFAWGASIGGIRDDEGLSVAIDPMGNVLTTGFFERDPDFDVPVDFDPGPDDFIMTSAGSKDAFVLKLDNDGNFVWAGRMGGASECIGQEVDTDEFGNVYTAGHYVGGFNDFDPGEETLELEWQGGDDVFLSRWDESGNLVWATTLAGDFQERGLALEVEAGIVYSTGTFFGTTDFDPAEGELLLSSVGSTDIYVHKMNQVLNLINRPQRDILTLYPNPTRDEVRIDGVEFIDRFAIYTTEGKKVEEGTRLSAPHIIETSALETGVYLLLVESQGETYTSKFSVLQGD